MRRSQPLLGTFVVITAFGDDRSHTQAAISAAFEEIRRVDSIMSLHRADSELAGVNAIAGTRAVEVSAELFTVIEKAMEIAESTDGAFDPTVAPLTVLWGFLWKEYRLPTQAELETVLPLVNYRAVALDRERRMVRFQREGARLDLNAIAKGYAVDCAIDKLREFGISNAMVRAGGDLRVQGAPPGKSAWEVQLEDPRKRGGRRIVELRDRALSTSGNYENFFSVGGKRYGHVIDPRTGMPTQDLASCSVVAATCMESDAWATACLVLGPDEALRRFGDRKAMLFDIRTSADEIRTVKSAGFPPISAAEPSR